MNKKKANLGWIELIAVILLGVFLFQKHDKHEDPQTLIRKTDRQAKVTTEVKPPVMQEEELLIPSVHTSLRYR
jgi:hypothetical protein